MPQQTLRATWTAFTPTPESIEFKALYLGSPLFTQSIAGDLTQKDFTAYYNPDYYAASVRAIYPPLPCSLNVV